MKLKEVFIDKFMFFSRFQVSSQKMKDELARMSPPDGFQDLTVPSTDGPPIVEVAMN